MTGNVSFYDGATLLGSIAVGANKTAALTTSALAAGSHNITATYAGDTNFGPSSAGGESAQQVQYRCPGATVVWVNQSSHIYHFPGTRDFGHTKRGAYMCEADAKAAGARAAMNEKHP